LDLNKTEKTRYALSSQEELWVKSCAKFFQTHGEWEWYKVPMKDAVAEILKHARGAADPIFFANRINKLYEGAGVWNIPALCNARSEDRDYEC
jgi:hypothetical protein